MKNRIKLWFRQIIYLLYDKYRFSIIVGIFFSIISAFQYGAHGKDNYISYIFPSLGLLLILIILLLVKHRGILMTYPKCNCTVVTMRGVFPAKLKKLASHKISEMFLTDFTKLLLSKRIHTDLVINTHALYAQGVLNVLYNLYDPEAKVPRITRETVDDTLNCYNEHIHIVKRGHHTNLMAATKISPVAKQAEIDGHFRKQYHFYEIRIPKNLIN